MDMTATTEPEGKTTTT